MSGYFQLKEFECKCKKCKGDINVGPGISTRLIEVLNAIRSEVGVSVVINSGYRCPEHNAAVGGSPRSQHVEGTAADIRWKGMDMEDAAILAEQCGADGIGIYETFIHVDVRGKRARWRG